MSTLMIKDLSRDEELDRKAMADVRGGQTVLCSPGYRAGMTVGEAIERFVQYGKCAHEVFSTAQHT